MNDLRLLQQVDPTKKIIALEFKQIASLDPMLPLLSKFQNLETLSLHGNRLKKLPSNLGLLENLVELDISNNLFTDIEQVVESLKTLPNLKHLIINFKNQQQENYAKNTLTGLERINKKPLFHYKDDIGLRPHKKIRQSYKLSERQMESVGILYDEIRQIYKQSKYLVDKELAVDFDRNVENIMGEISQKLQTNASQAQNNCHVLAGKFALIDLCFVKMITYFYHFDRKIANVLQRIHDHQADMFSNITELVFQEIQKSKIQLSHIKTKKQQLYKAQIRRLKNYQEESNRQLSIVEEQNKSLMKFLYKYSHTNVMEDTLTRLVNGNVHDHKKNNQNSSRSPSKVYMNKENVSVVTVRNKPKNLTLHQLKQLLNEIYQSKVKHNQICLEKCEPMETMQMHMYTYLNQKYGLRSLAIEWAMSVVNGIRKYGMDDPQVALFGKILRNQIQQEFIETIKRSKQMLSDSSKKFLGLSSYQQNNNKAQLTVHQCNQILLYMHLKHNQTSQILDKLSPKITNNLVSYQSLEYAVLDYYIRKHDQKLRNIVLNYRQVDTDQDGIIDYQQLQAMMNKLDPKINPDSVIQIVDNSGKGIITFSNLITTMNKMSSEFSLCFVHENLGESD